MNKLLSYLTAAVFAVTAFSATAATPKAAEDAGAPVYTTDAPKPHAKAKKAKKHHAKAKKAHKKAKKQHY